MEEQIIKGLLEFYKQKGIDLYAVLDDPLFVRLHTEQKVKILKQFASHIAAGTNTSLTKKDIRSVLIDAGLAGLATAALGGASAITAAAHFKGGKLPVSALALGTAVGAGVTALSTLYKARKIHNNRVAVKQELDNLSRNPTDINAIKVLAMRNYQIMPNPNLATRSTAVGLINNYVGSAPVNMVTKVIPTHLEFQTLRSNIDKPLRDGLSPEEFDKMYGGVKAKAFKR